MGKKVFFFFRIFITGAILFALFKFIPYKKLIDVYRDSQKSYLFLGLAVFFLCQILCLFRWRFLLSSLGIGISIREAFCASLCGLFLNLFFPSSVAGDVFRSFSISCRYGGAGKVASSVLMDRFSGGIALTLISLLAFIVGSNMIPGEEVIVALLALCAIAGFAALVIFSKSFFFFLVKIFKRKSLREKLISFHDKLYFFKNNPWIFIKSLSFSFLIQLLVVLGFFIISRAFNVKVSIIYFLVIVPIVIAITLIPITIAGAGTREASLVYFLSLVGVEKSVSLGISLFNLSFVMFMGIVGGIFYVSVYHRWLQSHLSCNKP